MTRADSLRLMLYFRTDASPRRFALIPASGASIWMSRISCEVGRGVQAAPGDVTALSRPRRGFEFRWGHQIVSLRFAANAFCPRQHLRGAGEDSSFRRDPRRNIIQGHGIGPLSVNYLNVAHYGRHQ